MTGTTGRLRRVAAIVGIGLAAAAVVTGTAVAANSGGDGHHGDPPKVRARPARPAQTLCRPERQQGMADPRRQITRGPVAISHGGQGKEPRRHVPRAVEGQGPQEREFNNAPMPYSVFFADGGIAFHQGNPNNPSAGCVHLSAADAQAWFDDLEVGDEVQVHSGNAARCDGEHTPAVSVQPRRPAMSVVVIVRFPGGQWLDRWEEAYANNAETMSKIVADGRGKGAVHHVFVEDENGDLMVVDEWAKHGGVRGLLRHSGRDQGDHGPKSA